MDWCSTNHLDGLTFPPAVMTNVSTPVKQTLCLGNGTDTDVLLDLHPSWATIGETIRDTSCCFDLKDLVLPTLGLFLMNENILPTPHTPSRPTNF